MDYLPEDFATCQEWLEFAQKEWGENSYLANHMLGLCLEHGYGEKVEFTTEEFLTHLMSLQVGYENDRIKWQFYEG